MKYCAFWPARASQSRFMSGGVSPLPECVVMARLPAERACLVLLVQLPGEAHGFLARREELDPARVQRVGGLVGLLLAGAEGVLLLRLRVVHAEERPEVADDEATLLRGRGHRLTGSGSRPIQRNAGMSVKAWPMARVWMSCVPSYVYTDSRLHM